MLTPLPNLLPWSETRLLIVSFNRYIDRLRALIARQERFSADVSHPLRTPLTVLKTQAGVALSNDDPQLWRESLVAMRAMLDNTIVLTERLLQLSRLSHADQDNARFLETVDLVQIAQSCCFSHMEQACSKHIDLGYEGPCVAWVTGEPLLLAEMCASLLDNALKYTAIHGVVTIRVTNELPGVLLEVEDNGPALKASMLARCCCLSTELRAGQNNKAGRESGWHW